MCGRYASSRPADELASTFGVRVSDAEELAPSWNVAPTDPVPAVLPEQLRTVRWGLVPPWAEDPRVGSRFINARSETVADRPAFRRAFASRRCLLPADGWYEWCDGRAYYLHPTEGPGLAFAGVYELWHGSLWTAAVITRPATDELVWLHDRMPVPIRPERWADWLDPAFDREEMLAMLRPPATGSITVRPVGPAVGDVRNNGPDLVRPWSEPVLF